MSAKADYKNCSHCCMPVHVPQKQPAFELKMIIGAMSKLALNSQTLIVATKKANTHAFCGPDHIVTIRRTEQNTWNVSIDKCKKEPVIVFTFTSPIFSDAADINISNPLCISHYIRDDCICSANVRIL